MTVTGKELVASFAKAVAVGDAAVFVGAGTSQGAGLPGWGDLIKEARETAKVPESISDAPLAAQYIAYADGGEGALHAAIKRKIDTAAEPTETHRLLSHLPIRDYWTTNYDVLIEQSLDREGFLYQWVVGEGDYTNGNLAAGLSSKRVIKMHGSLTRDAPEERDWQALPVITRADFERYEEKHPITWTRLRAAWLTNSLLFLGLSFDDPNLNLLLRLSRSLPADIEVPPHFVVFTEKKDDVERRLQKLRVKDLEKSGVKVHLIASREGLPPLLSQLQVRCRPANLFVSGSFPRGEQGETDSFSFSVAQTLAIGLAEDRDRRPAIVSFGGRAGQVVSREFRDAVPAHQYQPELVRFYHRKARPDETISIDHRVGMVSFTERTVEDMRDFLFPQVRALVVIAGSDRTLEEVEVAQGHGVLVVPVAATGGAAATLWEKISPESLGLSGRDELGWWQQLKSGSAPQAAHAAGLLIKRLMFE